MKKKKSSTIGVILNSSPAMKKMYLKMLSAEVVCCMQMVTSRTNYGILTNSVDPDQTAPKGTV